MFAVRPMRTISYGLIIYYIFDSNTSSFLSVSSKTEGFLCLCVDGKKDPYVAFEDLCNTYTSGLFLIQKIPAIGCTILEAPIFAIQNRSCYNTHS